MMYSFRIEQAIRAAAILHSTQVRRGKIPYPYVTHLFSVAVILSSYTNDEDTLVASLLHDVLEDTDYTYDELAKDFGEQVANLVRQISHSSEKNTDQNPWVDEWKERHARYITQLKDAENDALMISAADKIHNMRSSIEEYLDEHKRFMADFGGTLDERLANYQAIGNILNTRLNNDIVQEFNHVFDEYKKFIYETQKRHTKEIS